MKIGIMTCWTKHDNYGQQLQCYALQRYLRELGHDPYLIRYDNWIEPSLAKRLLRKAMHSYKIFIPGYIRKKLEENKKRKILKEERILYPRKFEEFRKRYLAMSETFYTTFRELEENPPEADIYMTGSDQVWHFLLLGWRRIRDEVRVYMLDFGKKETVRLSAAASWGRTSIPEKWKSYLKPFFENFQAVTIREESGAELCRQCGREAVVVDDPTVYLDAETYREIYRENEIRRPEKKYVMVYWVNNGGEPPMEEIIRWSGERGLAVEYVTGNGMVDGYPKNYATVPEWLYLIDYAEYVITNSFHAAVFSLLFQKRFGVIRISGAEAGMNDRLGNLFRKCGAVPRYLEGKDFSCLDRAAENTSEWKRIKLREAVQEWVRL